MTSAYFDPTVYWDDSKKPVCVVNRVVGSLDRIESLIKNGDKDIPYHLTKNNNWINKIKKYLED